MELVNVSPKLNGDYSQLTVECTRKFSRLWSRLFWLYGLQLHHDDEENNLPKWRKSVIILLPRIFAAVVIIRDVILSVRLLQYEVFILFFPAMIFNTVSIFTALVLHKREEKFSALYKIIFELALKNSDNIRQLRRYICTVILITAIFNFSLCILIIMVVVQNDQFLTVRILLQTEFNSYLYRVYVLCESIFYIIFSQLFLDITALYFSYMCKVLSLTFQNLNDEMECAFVFTSVLTNAKLNEFRRRYRYLLHLVEKISENFSPLLLVWLMGLVFIFCLRVRSIKPLAGISFPFYFALDASYLLYIVIVIFKNSSQLLVQIRKMTGRVTEIMIASDDQVGAHEDQESVFIHCLLFSQTLNDENIGINVSGLFILSTFSFLNMASIVMTYVVVVYQS
uniref:Gustatory receptor n=1 Tax=Strigamia maritima TaxID=126957 RepID=T1JKG9_STRMM